MNDSLSRWAASVKWCSDCKRESVGVLVKPHEWVCPHCGVIHERKEEDEQDKPL